MICPKCGSEKVKLLYSRIKMHGDKTLEHYLCWDCDYAWDHIVAGQKDFFPETNKKDRKGFPHGLSR